MKQNHVIIREISARTCVAIALTSAFFVTAMPRAAALESSSYLLYDSFPNIGTNGAPDSAEHYLLNENGLSWYPAPAQSTNYRVVTAPPEASASSQSSAAAEPGTGAPSSRGPSGGRRPRPAAGVPHPAAGSSPSSSVSSVPSVFSASSLSSDSSISSAPSLSDRGPRIGEPRSAATCIGPDCRCVRLPASGGMCRGAAPASVWSLLGLLCAVIEVLLVFPLLSRRRCPFRRSR